jgi:hypothetical protein
LKDVNISQPDKPAWDEFSVEHLKLTSLELNFKCLSMPQELVCSIVRHQKDMKSLLLPLRIVCINDESLSAIVSHTMMEKLVICFNDEPISRDIISKLPNMQKLKTLNIKTTNVELIQALSKFEFPKLEELSLDVTRSSGVNSEVSTDVLQSFGENLPNLKKLTTHGVDAKAILAIASLIKKLQVLKFSSFGSSLKGLATPCVNLAVRELAINSFSKALNDVIMILVEMLPNIEKLSLPCLSAVDVKLMNNIMKLQKLKELESSEEFLADEDVIQIIKVRGASLKKIVVDEISDIYKAMMTDDVYHENFPIMKVNFKDAKLIMSRA